MKPENWKSTLLIAKYTAACIWAPLCPALLSGAEETSPEGTQAPLTAPATVTAATRANLLIKDIHLVSREEAGSDQLVNILIQNGRLSVVSTDTLTPSPTVSVVDGQGGYLIGTLAVGAPPKLIILDRDPSTDISVLLDSREHVRFAFDNGVIVRNHLPTSAPTLTASRTAPTPWTAYEAPPLAMPLRYYDSRKWNRFDTKYISGLTTGALVLDRLDWLSQDLSSEEQVGDLATSDGGTIRAFRLGVIGRIKFKQPWTYTVFVASNTFDEDYHARTDDSLVWFDYRLDIPLTQNVNLSVGKQKETLSMERLMNLTFASWQERSAANDAFLPSRSFGAVINGTVLNERMTWAGGVFNNWIDADTSFEETSNQATGRVSALPYISEDGSRLLHLALGTQYTEESATLRFRSDPEFKAAPVFVDTEPFAADSVLTSVAEVYWRGGPYWFGMEYFHSDVDAPMLGDPTFSGYFIGATWAITGEMRPYNKRNGLFGPLPVSRPVTTGGWGAFEAAIRYSNIDLSDGAIEGGDMDILSLGVNWWLSTDTQLGMFYRWIELNRFGTTGQSSGANLRLILILD